MADIIKSLLSLIIWLILLLLLRLAIINLIQRPSLTVVLEFYLLNLVGDKKFFGPPLLELINLPGDSRSLRFLLEDDFFSLHDLG